MKFNLALVPLVAVGIAIMIWADYRHEYATLMEAHAAHTSTVGTGAAGGPMDPWTLPDVAARRSLTFHLVYGGALVALVIGAVNVVLGWYILRPVALMRQRLTGLQPGQWRGPVDPGGNDELGRVPGNTRLVLDLPAGTASVGPRRGQWPGSAECVGRAGFLVESRQGCFVRGGLERCSSQSTCR
jgi:hypothetical protein